MSIPVYTTETGTNYTKMSLTERQLSLLVSALGEYEESCEATESVLLQRLRRIHFAVSTANGTSGSPNMQFGEPVYRKVGS